MHAYERKNFWLGTTGREPDAQIYQKEKFDAETKPPHSNNVQRRNPKLGYRDLRVKNKNQARGKKYFIFTNLTIERDSTV